MRLKSSSPIRLPTCFGVCFPTYHSAQYKPAASIHMTSPKTNKLPGPRSLNICTKIHNTCQRRVYTWRHRRPRNFQARDHWTSAPKNVFKLLSVSNKWSAKVSKINLCNILCIDIDSIVWHVKSSFVCVVVLDECKLGQDTSPHPGPQYDSDSSKHCALFAGVERRRGLQPHVRKCNQFWLCSFVGSARYFEKDLESS